MDETTERRVGNEMILQRVDYVIERLEDVKKTVESLAKYQREQNGRVTQTEIKGGARDVHIANICKHIDTIEAKSDKRDWLVALISLLAAAIAAVVGGTR